MNVVVVESPAKAKTINKYLGKDFTVLASYGHVRDLPAKDGSVRPDEDFAMDWEVDGRSAKRVAEIASALKASERLILATDPDREGEAISWHVLELLNRSGVVKGKPVERVVFNAITRQAVQEAMRNPRRSMPPWSRPISPGGRSTISSASRCRRCCGASCRAPARQAVSSRWRCASSAIASSRSSRSAVRSTGPSRPPSGPAAARGSRPGCNADGRHAARQARHSRPGLGARHRMALVGAAFTVGSVESRPAKRHPAAPFTTSTLQQEASRKLGFRRSHHAGGAAPL